MGSNIEGAKNAAPKTSFKGGQISETNNAYISLLLLVPIHITSIWEKYRMSYVFPGSLILSTMIMFTVLGHTLFGFWEI